MHSGPGKIYRVLGQAVRLRRRKARLTQEKLGERAGLTRNYIGDVERAEKKVSIDSLSKIARALKCRLRDLFNDL